MKRKVVQVGKFTKVVSLPSKWVEKNKIKKGDDIDVEEYENKIVLKLDKGQSIQKIALDLSKGYDYNVRDIKAMYRYGYDEIHITFDNIEILNKLQKAISEQLMGFDIVNQDNKKCLIKNLMEESQTEIDTIIRRLFLLTLSMADESYTKITSRKMEQLNEVQAMERMNNKLCNLCERILNKKGYKEYRKTLFIYALIRELDQIADAYRDLCKYLIKEEKPTLTNEVLDIYKEVNALFRGTYEVFYKVDLAALSKHTQKREATEEKALELFPKVSNNNRMVLHYLLTVLMKINHLAESIVK